MLLSCLLLTALADPAPARDPFQPQAPAAATLQDFSVSELRLVGVVMGEVPTALLQDPRGVEHVVEVGTLLGGGFEVVKAIEAEALVVGSNPEALRRVHGEINAQDARLPLSPRR